MKRARNILIIFLFAFCGQAQDLRTSVAWEPNALMGNELFPAFLITTATMKYGDSSPIGNGKSVVVSVVAPSDGAKFKLVVEIPRLADNSVLEGVLPRRGVKYDLVPKINYQYDILTKIRQPIVVNSRFTLFINGQVVGQKIKPIRVRSINDAPMWWVLGNGRRMDMPFMVAAYVNEDHPWIDQLLREAINTRVVLVLLVTRDHNKTFCCKLRPFGTFFSEGVFDTVIFQPHLVPRR